jgi:hypothetical protein
MRTQTRLEKISTAISFFGMAMGFSVLCFLIVVNQHDGGASIPAGFLAFARCGIPDSSMPAFEAANSGRISARGG